MNRMYYRDGSSKKKEHEDLTIFGYSCAVSRDDEQSANFDEEKYLIPWMGDQSIMLDRFDVRGLLDDLSEFQKDHSSTPYEMTEAEKKEEELCEEERYFSLYHNELDIEAAKEEELKRLQIAIETPNSYKQVGFEYDDAGADSTDIPIQQPTYNPEDEAVFIPPPEIPIPDQMEIPKTIKHHKIILRTAKFVATQGLQMEILIKTKQSTNLLFNFLLFDHILNPYYKHLINLLKSGKIIDADEPKQDVPKYDECVLPPLLIGKPNLTPGVPSMPTAAQCSYSKLINQIQEKQKASGIEPELYSPSAPSSPMPAEPSNRSVGVVQRKHLKSLIPGSATSCRGGLVDYHAAGDDGSDCDDTSPAPNPPKSFNSTRIDYKKIKWPSRSLQMVIDKMACYIVKRGPAFQEHVKSRNDSRFQFMKKTDEYHPYFLCKIQLYSEVYSDAKSNKDGGKFGLGSSKTGSSGRSIKFSIKPKETEAPLTSHTSFPIESSSSEEDEDMDEEEREKRRNERQLRRQARREKEQKERLEREAQLKKEKLRRDDSSGNEDLYDIFKYAQEIEKDTTVSGEQNKQKERKKKAAAFLSKLKNGNKPVYGPQLPQEYDMSSPTSTNGSLKCPSPVQESIPDLLSPRTESPASLIAELEGTKGSFGSESPVSGKNSPRKASNAGSPLEDLKGKLQDAMDDGYTRSSRPSRTHRSGHKKSRLRSESRSPDRMERKKHKKSHSSHRRRYRSSSRSVSRSRSSRRHRSHHKKSKHNSHRSRKSKKHKRTRSPSVSSVTSLSTNNPVSDSDPEVQVIMPAKRSRSTSRSSSVISLPRTKALSTVPSSGNASSLEDNILSRIRQPLNLNNGDENTNSSLDDIEKKFNPSGSAALAKIAEGLRMKLHRMIDKQT